MSSISYSNTLDIGGNATQYPDITTASITGPEAEGDKLRYSFARAIGRDAEVRVGYFSTNIELFALVALRLGGIANGNLVDIASAR